MNFRDLSWGALCFYYRSAGDRKYCRIMGMEGDAAQAVLFLTADAIWATPHGTFKGASEITRYLTWMGRTATDLRIAETGIGILERGKTCVIEHNLSGITSRLNWEIPAMCIYECGDGKVKNIRTFFDRLSLYRQAPSGVLAKQALNAIVNMAEKELRY